MLRGRGGILVGVEEGVVDVDGLSRERVFF